MNLSPIVQDLYQPSAVTETTWVDWFDRWLPELMSDLPAATSYELSLRLTDDAEIQALNARFRAQDQPTDVLAFAALEVDFPHSTASDEPLYLGDIVISVDTATRQASEHGYTLARELAWLATHGLLHLLGWDHPDDFSLAEMLERQETLLAQIGL